METRREPGYDAMASPSHATLALVLTGYFFADAISAAIIHARAHGDLAGIFVFAVFASQAVLLAMWVGMGNAAVWIRLLWAFAWCVWITLLAAAEPERWEIETVASAGLMFLLATAPYGLLKVLGFRIVWRRVRAEKRWRRDALLAGAMVDSIVTAGLVEEPAALPVDSQRFQQTSVQFTLPQIFGWTALAGVLALLARMAGVRLDEVVPMCIPVFVATAVGLTSLWAVLGSQQVGGRILAPFVVVVLVTLIAVRFERRAPGELVVMIFSSLALATAGVAAVLGLFRAAGYRLRRNRGSMVRPGADRTAGNQRGALSPWDSESV